MCNQCKIIVFLICVDVTGKVIPANLNAVLKTADAFLITKITCAKGSKTIKMLKSQAVSSTL